jgi:integrase
MSIRRRSWTTSRGEAREAWIVDYADQAGKRRQKTFARKKDADAYQARTKVDVGEGVHTPDSTSITVAAAADLWLTTCRGRGLERSTLAGYEQTIRIHITPALGHLKLSKLSAPTIREFEDRLREGGVSSAMIRKIRTNLGALLTDAQERGLIARNVAKDLRATRTRGVDRRADKRQKGKLKVGVDIPGPAEIRAFVAALDGRWRPILLTAIFTGLRASELRGLRWADVDFDKNELHVRQRADRYLKIGPPKSEAGERSVPLPPIVANTLREWKLACPKGGLVFPTGSGKVESHSNILQRGLMPAMLAAGIVNPDGSPKYTGLHSLRHFYASWCINRKKDGGLELPLKVIQERLGHSTIALTSDVYSHLFPRGDDASELASAERSLLG